MQLQINPADAVPIYRQIVRQVVDAIVSGQLQPGEKLPSHRELAARLVVAPLTVKKAYDVLEQDGYLGTLRGRGTFVADALPDVDVEHLRARLAADGRRLLGDAALAGLSFDELVALLADLAQENGS